MNYIGLIIGAGAFFCIGLFHPLVIKSHYLWGVKSAWIFAAAGIFAAVASLLTAHYVVSTLLGVLAFSCFWSIFEVFEQRKRVEKGWFPKNPKRENR